VNALDLMPTLLLTLFSLALVSGSALIVVVTRARRQRRLKAPFETQHFQFDSMINPMSNLFTHRPLAWVAVRSRNLQAVQNALGLSNPHPCTWQQGLSSEQKLFIAPPIQGWILITGSGLPDPFDDVDICFRFLIELSRKLGHVQFFSANSVVSHHAWARAEAGCILRAYAWAGKTFWNQGIKTQAEIDLAMKCYRYCEASETTLFGEPDLAFLNTEKVSQLAAMWSIDPAAIDERVVGQSCGIAGEPRRLY
jgi:hypothetical protein